MMLVFPEGSWAELLNDTHLQCKDAVARGMEMELRKRLYYHEHFQDDTVMEDVWWVPKVIKDTGWGLTRHVISSDQARGAWHFDPVITKPADVKKLRLPQISVDEEATAQRLVLAQELFGDILRVKPCGVKHISFHMMCLLTGWMGLEETMINMYEDPAMLHEIMGIIYEGYVGILQQYEKLNLLSANNDETYQSTGGNGYTDILSAEGVEEGKVSLANMWGSAESQELTGVSPAMHVEFAMQYEKKLLEPFGLTGYGCCDDLSNKIDDVLAINRMRRISISPAANVDVSAKRLGNRAIYSWKPQPAHLVGEFNEPLIRNYIAHTLDVCAENGCVLEMILKDTHTCEGKLERFDRWTQIAREEVRKRYE